MLCDDLEVGMVGWGGGREALERGDICIHIADSLCSTAELIQHFKAIIVLLFSHPMVNISL